MTNATENHLPISVLVDPTPRDIAEASAVQAVDPVTGRPPAKKRSAWVGGIGWILFAVCAGILYGLTREPDAPPAIEPPKESGPLVIGLAIIGMGVVLLIAGTVLWQLAARAALRRWTGRRRWTITEDALICERPGRRDVVAWEWCRGFVETPRLFVIRAPGMENWVLPKSCFQDPQQTEAVRRVLQARCARLAVPLTLGYPVVMP